MASETFPVSGLKSCEWTDVVRQTDQSSYGGGDSVIEMGEPYWTISCRYENLSEAQHRAVTSFLKRRNGSMVPFRAYRPDRQNPLNIANAGSLSPSITEVSTGVMQITTGTNKLAEGDMVAYKTSTGARYVGEIADVLSTQTSSIQCELYPAAPTPNGSPDLQIYRAEGLFRLVPSSVQNPEPHDKRRSVTFSARQVEKPFTEPS
jgi:X-X-X-Leu-X-X-Gly heptad repeat protein